MTQQQLIEKIRRGFPLRLEPECRAALNEIQREFCKETRIIEGWFTPFTTTITDQYYDLDELVVEIKQVRIAGTDTGQLQGVYGNVPSNSGVAGWWIRDDQMGVGYLDSTGESVLGLAQEVTYYGVTMAADFTTDLSEESAIPPDYHRALFAGVMRDFSEDDTDLKAAAYWREVYADNRRRAKREANTSKDGTPHVVSAQGY